jgi:hypothetical protein
MQLSSYLRAIPPSHEDTPMSSPPPLMCYDHGLPTHLTLKIPLIPMYDYLKDSLTH